MQQNLICFIITTGVALLSLLPTTIAHGHDENVNMNMDGGIHTSPALSPPPILEVVEHPGSYFQYGEHSGLMVAHIVLMTLGWVFVLPVGVMLSIARSRYTLMVQFFFLAFNTVAVILAMVYNATTPDLYPNNAHHKIGWILTWVGLAQFAMLVPIAYTRRYKAKGAEREGFIPVSTEAMAEHHRLHDDPYRFSNDSGQGTEPNTESLRSQSISSTGDLDQLQGENKHEELNHEESLSLLHGTRLDVFLISKIPGLLSSRVLRIFRFLSNLVDRVILILAFIALSTGIVTYTGLFMGERVFSGLAHFIKGGVFFWYGILTLGRWAGCFADIGWSWNISPSKHKRPSAEFVESFLIFFYGSTNVFLEHLNAWGKAWTAQDLEHISITTMFFGGGLLGMLIESQRVRALLNVRRDYYLSRDHDADPPKSYRFSMNPIPALIVMLLGMMMSSHHQESMFSTMVHKQWGTLLVGAAFARAATYIIFYLAPPVSTLPGRPPTELITAFCLMAGGLVFMVSARDSVMSLEFYELDAMFVFTVSMGLVTSLMAWIIIVIGIKGWAVKKEDQSIFTFRRAGMA